VVARFLRLQKQRATLPTGRVSAKNIPFLDDKPEPADDKEVAFRSFFAELASRLFGDTG
jgi:hypothetical protein